LPRNNILKHSTGRYSAGTLLAGYVLVDTLIFIFFILILPDFGAEETAVAAYWVTDGIDCCHVGFLPCHMIQQAQFYDGKLVQVVAMLADSENLRLRQYSRHNIGVCKAAMIDTVVDDYVPANGFRRCCMDAIARSVLQDKEMKNDNESSKFLSAQEEEERKKED
jgi:hypothetical protein